jgi:hypothetical protein
MDIATRTMRNYAECIPDSMWDNLKYENGKFDPIARLVFVTSSDNFFRTWISDAGQVTFGKFQMPEEIREALESCSSAAQQMRLASFNQLSVRRARSKYSSLDELLEAFSKTRVKTLRMVESIPRKQFLQPANDPVTGQCGTLGTVAAMLFVTHVLDHAFTMHAELTALNISAPSIYYDR